MNLTILSLFILNVLGIIFFFLQLKKYFMENKEFHLDKFVKFLKFHLNQIFQKEKNPEQMKIVAFSWMFFVLLHTITPLFFSLFLLKTDGNVFIAIFTILASIQLLQKIYPGQKSIN